jgi:polyhydroxyalkanoate synthesis regulator phasin
VAKVEVNVSEETGEEERNPLFDATRKVLLASMGAMALAQDEMESFVHKLVERGELAEQDGKKLIRDVMDRRRKEAEKAEDEMEGRVQMLLDRMNVPTKSDIEKLSAKVTELGKKIDELKAQ